MSGDPRRLVLLGQQELVEDLMAALADRGVGRDAFEVRAVSEDEVPAVDAGEHVTVIVVGPDSQAAAEAALAAGATAYLSGAATPAQLADGVVASLRRP